MASGKGILERELTLLDAGTVVKVSHGSNNYLKHMIAEGAAAGDLGQALIPSLAESLRDKIFARLGRQEKMERAATAAKRGGVAAKGFASGPASAAGLRSGSGGGGGGGGGAVGYVGSPSYIK